MNGPGSPADTTPTGGGTSMAEKCRLKDLFIEELRDIYHAEGQLVKALPKMAKTVNNADLKAAIEHAVK